jgi:hypothetical protein
MSKFVAKVLAGAVALSGVATFAGSASAGTVILDISETGNGITVVSTPADDLKTATNATTKSWSLTDSFILLPPLTGSVTSFTLTNPVELSPSPLATNTLMITIGGVTYTDHLTEIKNGFKGVVLTGELMGGTLGKNNSELDISYNQSFGTGHLISANATFAVETIVPEPSTWAMLLLGFAGLGYSAFRRTAKSRVAAGAI